MFSSKDHIEEVIQAMIASLPSWGILVYHFFIGALPLGILCLSFYFGILQVGYIKYKWMVEKRKNGDL